MSFLAIFILRIFVTLTFFTSPRRFLLFIIFFVRVHFSAHREKEQTNKKRNSEKSTCYTFEGKYIQWTKLSEKMKGKGWTVIFWFAMINIYEMTSAPFRVTPWWFCGLVWFPSCFVVFYFQSFLCIFHDFQLWLVHNYQSYFANGICIHFTVLFHTCVDCKNPWKYFRRTHYNDS